MTNRNLLRPYLSLLPTFYEGEGTAVADPAVVNPANSTGANPNQGQATFTQEQVNKFLQTERLKFQNQAKQTVEQLKKLQEREGATLVEKEQLQAQIEQLEGQYRTKEELAKVSYDKLEKQYKTETTTLAQDKEAWRTRFTSMLQNNEILGAASEHKAFNPGQIVAILAPMTKVVERLGEDGKPTGEFVAQVSFLGKDTKTGDPIPLQLSVKDAVKMMTEMPEMYGNLFRTEANGGIGGTTNGGAVGNGRIPDVENMSPEQYKANRAKIHTAMRKAP